MKPQISRIVSYRYEGRFLDFDKMGKILEKAKKAGVLTQFDHTLSGNPVMSCVWFEGPPGKNMRAVRDAISALVVSR